ncbi:hypothetical protein [Flavivirga spongiicola]|uniref:Uncharacterized protein n=1 Tax=Flavivirga spongiicola TaxID=421621 RepID=A0ABU7XZC5_9FLAO|nr:hypothetical protein [Flavivirga sp. MEBiC05379]MDO5981147.1 hypothetical protein [Flavivirga sp. MEBiC05379]
MKSQDNFSMENNSFITISNINKYQRLVLSLIFALFITSVSTNQLHATTIVIIVTSDYVLLGVDSKMGIEDGITGELKFQEIVKIFEVGKYYFSASGVIGKMSNLNVLPYIIGNQIKDGDNFNSAIAMANTKLKESLLIQAEDIRKGMPDYYNSVYLKHNPVFTYVIIGLEEGIPFAYMCRFSLTDSKTYQLETVEKVFPLPSSKKTDAKAFYIGSHSAIDEYVKDPTVFSKHPDQVIKDLLMTEVKANPDKTGLPLNIVKIYKNGKIEWIKRSEKCPIKI